MEEKQQKKAPKEAKSKAEVSVEKKEKTAGRPPKQPDIRDLRIKLMEAREVLHRIKKGGPGVAVGVVNKIDVDLRHGIDRLTKRINNA